MSDDVSSGTRRRFPEAFQRTAAQNETSRAPNGLLSPSFSGGLFPPHLDGVRPGHNHDAPPPLAPPRPQGNPPPRQHVIFVHGTYSETAERRWAAPDAPFARAVQSHFNTRSYDTVAWNGGATETDRQQTAVELLQRIREAKESLPNHEVNIVAHSHGGNIVGRTLGMMEDGESVSSVMTLGTPQFRKQSTFRHKDKTNTVWGNDALSHVRNEVVNVYSRKDYIQTKGAGARNRANLFSTTGDRMNHRVHSGRRIISESDKVQNIDATNVAGGLTDAHGSFHTPEVFSEISTQIKEGLQDAPRSRRGSIVLPPKPPMR